MTDILRASADARDILHVMVRDCGLFTPDELRQMAADLDGWAADGTDRTWMRSADGQAAAMLAPEPMAPDVWNLLFLGTRPGARRAGRARALVAASEDAARDAGARLVLVDTASVEEMAPARAPHGTSGYEREAVIRDYWAEGVDKVTFRKAL